MKKKQTEPNVGSYILQKSFPLPVGRIRKSTGIYEIDRFDDLKRCVRELWERGRTDDLIKLKEGKISCIQLLTAWNDRTLFQQDWDTIQQPLWNSFHKWLGSVELADTTFVVYRNTIKRLQRFASRDDAVVTDLPMI